MPISITQAERELLTATLCLFVLEKAGAHGEGGLVFDFLNVFLALVAEYPLRNRRLNTVWDECHQIPICRGDGRDILFKESPPLSYSDMSFPVRAACLSSLEAPLKL